MSPYQDPKTEKGTIPSVAVDGIKIRTLRETKKLTQLYIASVVGVTTDTISRWENNRYPTIKRDNAEKLAEALEVSVDEIIRSEEPAVDTPAEPLPGRGHRPAWLLPLILALVLTAGSLATYLLQGAPPAATRVLPPHTVPGSVVPVQLKVARNESGSRGLIIKERLPAGWQLVKAAPVPSGTAATEEIKWLVPAGEGPITISYTVRAPEKALSGETSSFSGRVGVHDGGITRTVTTGGSTAVAVNGCHWADVNCDGRIDDNEIMPAYYLTDEMKGLGVDWQTIEAIWNSRGYRWDGSRKEFTLEK